MYKFLGKDSVLHKKYKSLKELVLIVDSYTLTFDFTFHFNNKLNRTIRIFEMRFLQFYRKFVEIK